MCYNIVGVNIDMEELSPKSVSCDRRLHPRYSVHYLCDVYLGSEVLFATVLDISEKGVGIILPKEFFENEMLNLKINCRLIDNENNRLEKVNIYLRASVVWIKKDGDLYKAGLKICDISYEDMAKLRDHINFLKKI